VKATIGASGVDLRASQEFVLPGGGGWATVDTGLAIELPPGYEAQVRARSGLAAKHGIGVLNGPGTVDSDYRGELKVILFNISQNTYKFDAGERIAQMIIIPVPEVEWVEVDNIGDTVRGADGIGSTGTL
jgi:dUTP pyrophosphatase